MKLHPKHIHVAGFLAAFATSAHAMQCAPISETKELPKRTFQLSGILREQWFWGPPNFGEQPTTDAHYQGWMVTLDHPLRLFNWPHGDEANPNKQLREVQIRFLHRAVPNIRALAKKHVVVIGPLELGTGPADQTLVVSWPTSIHASGEQLATECLRNVD